MNDNNDVRVKHHPVHRVDPVSRLSARRARRLHAVWKDQIVQHLADGKATTRMLSRELSCQASDITRPVLELRKCGVIIDAGVGYDPYSGYKAHFWALKDPGIADCVSDAS